MFPKSRNVMFLGICYIQTSNRSTESNFCFFLCLFACVFLDFWIFFGFWGPCSRENRRGPNSLAYVVSSSVVMLPFLALGAFLYCAIAYWLEGLHKDARQFFTYCGVFVLVPALVHLCDHPPCWG